MPNNVLKARIYRLLSRAVEDGARAGVRRAFKHSEVSLGEAQIEQIVDQVSRGVMLEVEEWFDFGDEDE